WVWSPEADRRPGDRPVPPMVTRWEDHRVRQRRQQRRRRPAIFNGRRDLDSSGRWERPPHALDSQPCRRQLAVVLTRWIADRVLPQRTAVDDVGDGEQRALARVGRRWRLDATLVSRRKADRLHVLQPDLPADGAARPDL